MRVLHVTAPAPVGGLESVVAALSSGQRARGHEVGVVVSRTPSDADGPHPFVDGLHASGVPVHDVVSPSWSIRREWAAIERVVRERSPDVIHTHGTRGDLLGGGVALRTGIPVVSTLHGDSSFTLKARALRRLHRRVLRRFSGVVTVSRPLRDALLRSGVPERRLHLVPNAWVGGVDFMPRGDATAALSIHSELPRLGWVGRISPEKGPDIFVDALAILDREGVDLCVSIVGDGPMRAALEERTARCGTVDVEWHGSVAGAARLFRAFDLLVLSSRTEGTPIVLLEAMAAGVPIIAADVGGVGDLTGPDGAVLVPAEDPRLLADAIRRAVANPEGARARATTAMTRVQTEYAADPWLDRYDSIYSAVTSDDHGTSTLGD